MAENYSKSKLKRKKSSVEDLQPEIYPRGTVKRRQTSLFSSDTTAEPRRSEAPAAVWWDREPLPAVETLWALTLQSALPYLQNQHWDLVPDLPHPSAVRPTALKLDEQRWCDSEEVAPFPEPSPPSLRTLLCPNPPRPGTSQQGLSVETKTVTDPPDRHSGHSHNSKMTSLQTLARRLQPSLHSWEGAASSAGPPSVGGEEGRAGGDQEGETGPVNKQLLANRGLASDSRASLQQEGENKEEEEVQRSVRGDGGGGAAAASGGEGGGLQSCPLCLLVFPVGFTQMDRDGHLAQCLSEVNVDVTW